MRVSYSKDLHKKAKAKAEGKVLITVDTGTTRFQGAVPAKESKALDRWLEGLGKRLGLTLEAKDEAAA